MERTEDSSYDENYEFNAPQFYDFLKGDTSSDKIADEWFNKYLSPIKSKKSLGLFDKFTPKKSVNKETKYQPKRTIVDNKKAEKHFEDRNKKIHLMNNKFNSQKTNTTKTITSTIPTEQKKGTTHNEKPNANHLPATTESLKSKPKETSKPTLSSNHVEKEKSNPTKSTIIKQLEKRRESRHKKISPFKKKTQTTLNPEQKEKRVPLSTLNDRNKQKINTHTIKLTQPTTSRSHPRPTEKNQVREIKPKVIHPSKVNHHHHNENQENNMNHKSVASNKNHLSKKERSISKLTSPHPFRFMTERRANMRKYMN